jgi:hypothetical protein
MANSSHKLGKRTGSPSFFVRGFTLSENAKKKLGHSLNFDAENSGSWDVLVFSDVEH